MEIQDWLISQIARSVQTDPGVIDIRELFSAYGLSSLDAVTLSGDLEEFLGRRLSPTIAYDHPSISALSAFLVGETENTVSPTKTIFPSAGSPEPIAVIGMSCRLPGANNPDAFWQLLRDGVDAITEVPKARWDKEAFYHPDPAVPGKSVSRWGGFLNEIDQFDPFFFGISPVEAKHMDPQQRLLMELSYEALDDAGQVIKNLEGSKTGVFIGISVNEYSQLQFGDPARITSHSGTGNALSVAANRISYFYHFNGPSIALDTACSSSLAAIHLACQSLRKGECTLALAGGVNMILSPAHAIAFTKAGVLSPDGRCKTFDSEANGYVRGEGGGMVILKPLSSALADGDPIQALILGSVITQDGRTNGLMAPSREAQEKMLQEAYRLAGVSPGDIQYVEAHGTGTLLGDAIEAQALGAVIGANRTDGPCAIGSVKTNIGHLESAAGIAGLIKVILSLKNRSLPPSIHYHTPNRHIPFNDLNLFVNNKLAPWPSCSGSRLAGINSFGFGGTNVHLVVRDADNLAQEKGPGHATDTKGYLLPLSADKHKQLQLLAGDFQQSLASDFSVSVEDICYAAARRRSQFHHRLAVVGHSREELKECLQAFLNDEKEPCLFTSDKISGGQAKVAFVFSGQGGQWFGMGRELLKQEPVFHTAIAQMDEVIQSRFSWSLLEAFCKEESESRLAEIDAVQPALFAIQVALSTLLQSWGITPDAVVGHSMGEIAAAHIAGILRLEDAIQIVCSRSKLLKQFRGKGRMLATDLSPVEAAELLNDFGKDVSIAVINSPSSTVLSGNTEAIEKLRNLLERRQRFCKLVNVDVASHSPQMDELRSALFETLDGLHPQPSQIPFYSTVTGSRGDHLSFTASYWMDNLRKPVLFSDAVNQMLESGYSNFIEIGPHPVLLGSIQQSLQAYNGNVRLLSSLRRQEAERKTLLETLAALYTEGFSINWSKLYPTGGKHVHLPLIPWQRQRYWVDTPAPGSKNFWCGAEQNHPLIGKRMNLANSPSSFVWQASFDETVLHFLSGHRIENEIVFPAAGYIEMALQCGKEAGLGNAYALCDFVFKERMILDKHRVIQTHISAGKDGLSVFSVYSRAAEDENWVLHASANFVQNQLSDYPNGLGEFNYDELCKQNTLQQTPEKFYQRLQSHGLRYGPAFQGIEHVWSKDGKALGLVRLPEMLQYESKDYQIHPALLDACLQVMAAMPGSSVDRSIYLPTGCKEIRFYSQPDHKIWSQVCLRATSVSDADTVDADIRLFNNNHDKVAELLGFRLQRTGRQVCHLPFTQNTWLYRLQWQPSPEQSKPSGFSGEGKHWLILADEEGLGEDLAKRIEAGGDYCHLWHCKEMFEKVNSASHDSLIAFIERKLYEISWPLHGIVHLWSFSTPKQSSAGHCSFDYMQMYGCESTLLLVQALAKSMAVLPRLWLVTRGAQLVKNSEPVAAEQSALWGLGKVIRFEFPDYACIRIDLDPLQAASESAQLLVQEITLDDQEDEIAYRAGIRYVHRLLPFTPKALYSEPGVAFRSDGTYLITGGLGALGLKIAEWMVQHGANHLVLFGRNEPSLAARKIVELLQHQGVDVLIAKGDVSDPVQLRQLVEEVQGRMPVMRGVIHAAGVLDDGALRNLNPERMRKVMAPKVAGTWNLHEATAGLPLDFFVLFSSAVSVLGSPGQGNYAAASAYLDAFAQYRRSLGLPAISINWGPWADVGLAAEATKKLNGQNASTEHLIKVIQIDQGLEILGQLLTEVTPQVMVLPFDLKNLIALYPTAAGLPFLTAVGGNDNHVARLYARPKLRQQYVAPNNEIERKLAQLWQQTLHIDRVGVDDSFFELGGDSVLAAQVLTSVQKHFGIRIDPQDAFKAFTIKKLAELLEAEFLQRLEAMSEEEAQRLLKEGKQYAE